eukprot:4741798-Prymnesium_polylepis.2
MTTDALRPPTSMEMAANPLTADIDEVMRRVRSVINSVNSAHLAAAGLHLEKAEMCRQVSESLQRQASVTSFECLRSSAAWAQSMSTHLDEARRHLDCRRSGVRTSIEQNARAVGRKIESTRAAARRRVRDSYLFARRVKARWDALVVCIGGRCLWPCEHGETQTDTRSVARGTRPAYVQTPSTAPPPHSTRTERGKKPDAATAAHPRTHARTHVLTKADARTRRHTVAGHACGPPGPGRAGGGTDRT